MQLEQRIFRFLNRPTLLASHVQHWFLLAEGNAVGHNCRVLPFRGDSIPPPLRIVNKRYRVNFLFHWNGLSVTIRKYKL